MHESRAQNSASLAQQREACGVTISSSLTELMSNFSFALAWVCILPLLWAGQQARYYYVCCLHILPGYKSEISAAAAKHQIEKAELQQNLIYQLAMQHDTAAKQLAAKASQLAALQASGQFAQSEIDRLQRQLDALTAAHSDVQHQLHSSCSQFEQMQKSLDAKDAEIAAVHANQQSALREQKQQQALHAVKEAAQALVSAAQSQSAAADAAADADSCSQQRVLRNVQRDRKQLRSAVSELEREKATLLNDGLSYLQQLQDNHTAVFGWQQAYTVLQQDAQSQLDRAKQVARERERQMQASAEDLRQAKLAINEAEAAKNRILDEVYPVYIAEVTIHSQPAVPCYDSSWQSPLHSLCNRFLQSFLVCC